MIGYGGMRGLGQADVVGGIVTWQAGQAARYGGKTSCSPMSDTNCPWSCLWALTPSCDSNLATRTAAQGGPSWYCSLPGSSVLSGCIPTPPAPPTVSAPTGSTLTTPPASGADAQGTVDGLLAQQYQDWQNQNTQFFQQQAQNPIPTLGVGSGNGSGDGSSLCGSIFGTGIAGALGQVLCPVVMIVGGVAVIALVVMATR